LRPWLRASIPFVRSRRGFPLFTATFAVHLFNDFRIWCSFACTPNWLSFSRSVTQCESLAAGGIAADRHEARMTLPKATCYAPYAAAEIAIAGEELVTVT